MGGLDPIIGAIGAGVDFYMAGKYLLNESLVPLGLFDDESVNHESSGFTLALDGSAIRSIRPTDAVDTGTVQRINPTDPTRVFGVTRMVSPPTAPSPRQLFSSTLSTLRDGRIISASSAGVVVMPAAFDSGLGNRGIEAITNGADFSPDIAPGSLISIFGDRFATQAQSAKTSPLPTKLNGACVSANGSLLPLLYVGPNQINAQMLYGIGGTTSVQVHTADGIGDIFVKDIQAHAPAIFGVHGPNSTRFAAIYRENHTLATLSNPIRTNESFVIYITGLGEVNPSVVAGNPAPADILSETTVTPSVTIGGVPADVTYSGLTPGFSGLYQINARTAGSTPEGVELPMVIEIGGGTTTVNVRIIED